ncbi:SusC/RagA family TonB-linked outer membrane protein [Pedobacter sp. LMG 31464]|uniref:SusC/RagA family TonB-linked outer membrane protein n=1 Tax=Pedobacter planticolens TaxID=2679964 RepID=A0A923DXR3_9SPHI|nr:SusC/RagA family TonB-linked outer membrane protein [Pedobacter planticolens]MBB2143857.1 SusC/RagA family TonB-linked outer membrane protein [Pedobacter planticolens]
MKQKLLLLMVMSCWLFNAALAQQITIKGKITGSDGLPIPGASIKVQNTQKFVASDSDGNYAIALPNGSTALEFSFVGFVSQTKTIGTARTIDVVLVADSKTLIEVVITALGEKRESRSLGYAATEISSEKLTVAKNTDISTALAGKVAGVQLNGSPSSSFDNASVIVRGINGFSVGSPLFIVDGTPATQENVNMDNIESVTVLKGAAATALYGQRAYNGVVIITSKKGTRKAGTSVEINSGVAFEKTSLLPDYQNEYAGGYTGQFVKFVYDPAIHPVAWAAFNGQNMLDYGADASFGPKIDGTTLYRPYYSWYPGEDFGKQAPLTAQPDNVNQFLQTGGSYNNSIAFTAGGEGFNLHVGYTNQSRTLVQENSKRSMNILNLNGSFDISKRFSVSTDFQFAKESRVGQPYETYRNDGLNVVQGFNQWFQRQLDMNYLKAHQTLTDGTITSWNIGDPNGSGDFSDILQPQYWDNPFWVINHNYRTQRNNRLVGNLGLKYDLGSGLALTGFLRGNVNNESGDERMATGGLKQDYFKDRNWTDTEFNYELNLTYKKTFGDFSLSGLAAGNIRHEKRERIDMATAGGLSFPNYFNIAASVARPTVTNDYYEKEVRSVFGKASLAYKNYLYVDLTARNDWSSVFASDLNSYFYPSASLSFIASEFFPDGLKSILSFAKLRGAYAQVGSDVDPYRVNLQYNTSPAYENNPSLAIGNEFRDGRLVPAKTNSFEVGAELKFLKNRIGLDFAYYINQNRNQILGVTLNGATGYTSNLINAGSLTNRGIEFSLTGTPVKSKNVNWDLTLNFSKSKTIVNKITDKQSNVIYQTSQIGNTLNLREGEEWGYVLGRKWNRDANGNVIIGANGLPTSTANQFIGYARPKFNGGAFSSLKVFDFDLGFSLDFQKGGLFNSTTRAYNMGSGLSQETVGLNDKGIDWRLPVSQGGGYKFVGVLASGQPNTKYVAASTAFYNGMQAGSGELFMISASYLKLREVRLGYNLPNKILLKTKYLKSVNLGFVVGNAWLIAAPGKKYGVDPSEIENFWQEGGQLPSSRTFGLNLKIGL